MLQEDIKRQNKQQIQINQLLYAQEVIIVLEDQQDPQIRLEINGKYTFSTTIASLASDWSTCTAGYCCLRGVVDPIIWPVGYYCTLTQLYPVPCDQGTFRATTGAASTSDCTLCTACKVCSQTAMTAPDKDCDAGFYCPAGSVFYNYRAFMKYNWMRYNFNLCYSNRQSKDYR